MEGECVVVYLRLTASSQAEAAYRGCYVSGSRDGLVEASHRRLEGLWHKVAGVAWGEEVRMQPQHVKALLMCARTGTLVKYCLPISEEVPAGFRCQPSDPVDANNALPALCRSCRLLALDPQQLQAQVMRQVSEGWAEHERIGAVVVGC